MSTSFGNLIREYRRRLGWNQEQLAAAAGLRDHTIVSRAEYSSTVTQRTARALIEALDRGGNGQEGHHFTLSQLYQLAAAYLIPPDLQGRRIDSHAIALLVPGIDHNYAMTWSELAGVVEMGIAEAGYTLLLSQHRNDDHYELQQLQFFEDISGLAGVILAPASGISSVSPQRQMAIADTLARLQARQVPVILVDRRPHHKLPLPFVGFDNERAGYIAVETLIALGHRRIAALLGLRGNTTQQERLRGYIKALQDHGIGYDERLVEFGDEVAEARRSADRQRYGIYQGRRRAEALLTAGENRPTAFFCGAYYMAIEAMNAVRSGGSSGEKLRIPEDMSLVTIDDYPSLDLAEPKVARVRHPIDEIGQVAVKKVLALIKDFDDANARRDFLAAPDPVLAYGSMAAPPQASASASASPRYTPELV